MKAVQLLIAVLFLFELPLEAQQATTELNAAASLLFNNTSSTLTNAEKNDLAAKAGFSEKYITEENKKGDRKRRITIFPVDLNSDKNEDIFICVTTKFLGLSQYEFYFFVNSKNKIFQPAPGRLGFGTVRVLRGNKKGFPDLIAGEPGTNREIWSWNGSTYTVVQKISGNNTTIYQAEDINKLSWQYSQTVKQDSRSTSNDDEPAHSVNHLVFKTLQPDYVIKKLFSPLAMTKSRYYKWKPALKKWQDLKIWKESDSISNLSDDGYLYTRFDTAFAVNNGTEKIIMFFVTPPFMNGEVLDCHACSGTTTSSAIFIKQADGTYLLSKLVLRFDEAQAFAEGNPVSLVKVGPNKFAVKSSGGDSHGEQQEFYETYYETDSLKFIFSTPTFESGGSLNDIKSTETIVNFLAASNGGDYFLLQTIATGRRDKGGKTTTTSKKTTLYAFDIQKGEYSLQVKPAQAGKH